MYILGGFNYFFFARIAGEMIQFDLHIFFQMGWFNHQLVYIPEAPINSLYFWRSTLQNKA